MNNIIFLKVRLTFPILQLNDTSFLHEIDKLHYPFSSEQFESEYDFILPFEDIATITEFWGIKCFTKMILLKYELW